MRPVLYSRTMRWATSRMHRLSLTPCRALVQTIMQTEIRIIQTESNDANGRNRQEAMFGNANGYIGVCGTLEEGVPSQFPTMQTIGLTVAGEEFLLWPESGSESGVPKDRPAGFTEYNDLGQSPSGKKIRIRIRRMAHFLIPELLTIEYEAEPLNFAGELVFDSYHIPEAAAFSETDSPGDGEECFCELTTVDKGFRGDTMWSLTEIQKSDMRIALASRHTVSKEEGEEIVLREEGERLITRIRIPAQKAEKVTLFKYITVSDSIRQKDPNTHAYSVLKKAISSDIRDLYEKQSTYLCSVFHI